jgi:starch phosphorylase
MDKYFSDYYGSLGLTRDQFLALGRINSSNTGSSADEPFNMAVLALHLSAYANGVSKLHRGVSRRMWQPVWPGVPVDEIPISSITNGVHLPSWVSHDMADLFDRYLGPDWRQDSPEGSLWSRADDIPEEELWRTHERRRERLVAFARRRLRSQLEERGAAPSDVEKAREVLDPEALTIGFARRFASYKRSTLIFRNMERLAAILNDKQRPVQIIMAGKAHPMDSPAKELIKTIIQIAGNPELRHRIVFLENYDMAIARYMLQGVDIWLNTPLRFMEASGTSGMKAAANGAVNLSVLDGWWDEAYQPEVGWAIGRGEVYDDRNYQDDVESNALYDLLEKEIIPSFYDRGSDGLPRRWSARMKAMMRVICPYFNTNRMVREYTEQCYVPLMQRYVHLSANGHARAKALARWKAAAHDSWPLVRVMDVKTRAPDEIRVGTDIEARAVVHVGGLGAKDISVELYHGLLDAQGEIKDPQVTPMTHVESRGDGDHVFRGTISVCCSGKYGYTIRVMPHQEDLGSPYQPGLITWA